MGMKNIEMFEIYTGKVFTKLYDAFPLRENIDVCELLGVTIDQESMGVPHECQIAYDTVVWLEKSGYIQIDSKSERFGFFGVVLSAKGLEVLKAAPASIAKRDGIGEQIRDVVRNGKKEAIRASVNAALSYGARMAFGVRGVCDG